MGWITMVYVWSLYSYNSNKLASVVIRMCLSVCVLVMFTQVSVWLARTIL